MRSSGVWISVIPFARLTHVSPRSLKTFASAPPPGHERRPVTRAAQRRAASATARHRGGSGSRGSFSTSRLHLALLQRSRRRRRRRASPAPRPRACVRRASALRPPGSTTPDDVASGPALDPADVRRRLLFETAEPQVGNRARRGGDRRPALLRIHAGVRGAPVEAPADRGRRRRAKDDLADRSRLVEHVPHRGAKPRVVERGAPRSPTSSFGVNTSSMPACRRPSATTRRTASSMTATAALLSAPRIVPPAFRRRRPPRRARSAPRAGRCPGARRERAAAARRSSHAVRRGREVADRRADLSAGLVLLDIERKVSQVRGDRVGDRPFLARRARDRRQLGEEVDRRWTGRAMSIRRHPARTTAVGGP